MANKIPEHFTILTLERALDFQSWFSEMNPDKNLSVTTNSYSGHIIFWDGLTVIGVLDVRSANQRTYIEAEKLVLDWFNYG